MSPFQFFHVTIVKTQNLGLIASVCFAKVAKVVNDVRSCVWYFVPSLRSSPQLKKCASKVHLVSSRS